jgi:hypothetical protein
MWKLQMFSQNIIFRQILLNLNYYLFVFVPPFSLDIGKKDGFSEEPFHSLSNWSSKTLKAIRPIKSFLENTKFFGSSC